MTQLWQPTHKVTPSRGQPYEVMLDEGAGYTREEWNLFVNADLEYSAKGEWTFLGEPFVGRVERLTWAR